jgi:hypothetical protein
VGYLSARSPPPRRGAEDARRRLSPDPPKRGRRPRASWGVSYDWLGCPPPPPWLWLRLVMKDATSITFCPSTWKASDAEPSPSTGVVPERVRRSTTLALR